jgi:hypothetical protein
MPKSILRIGRVLPTNFPAWYVMLQAVFGVAQVTIGILMVVATGELVWGCF